MTQSIEASGSRSSSLRASPISTALRGALLRDFDRPLTPHPHQGFQRHRNRPSLRTSAPTTAGFGGSCCGSGQPAAGPGRSGNRSPVDRLLTSRLVVGVVDPTLVNDDRQAFAAPVDLDEPAMFHVTNTQCQEQIRFEKSRTASRREGPMTRRGSDCSVNTSNRPDLDALVTSTTS